MRAIAYSSQTERKQKGPYNTNGLSEDFLKGNMITYHLYTIDGINLGWNPAWPCPSIGTILVIGGKEYLVQVIKMNTNGPDITIWIDVEEAD